MRAADGGGPALASSSRVIAPISHGAGRVSVNVMLLPETAIPDTGWLSMYCFITAALVAAAAG